MVPEFSNLIPRVTIAPDMSLYGRKVQFTAVKPVVFRVSALSQKPQWNERKNSSCVKTVNAAAETSETLI